ncbi:cyclase [Arthrobacter globiformis]|uniref:Cyclase n=1 Tax=Arthrobacter globiformis TaxID=1665 RepID=A0A328HI81_ARTGO|nr:cyclase [Arthrobacter globiformis]RAM38242.1 cyclase [Arthrobacter globiformis]
MAVSLVLHRVADYDAWREVYDSVADMQNDGGVTQQSVHRMADDPDNVLVIHHFDTVETARAFFARPDLKDAMQRAGVQGEPRIEYFE